MSRVLTLQEAAYERSLEGRLVAAEKGLERHEEVCAVRWGQILERMKRMESTIYWAAGILITGMGVVIWVLIQKVAHIG